MTTQIQKQIEEAVERFKDEFGVRGMLSSGNQNDVAKMEVFLRYALSAIAIKSAERAVLDYILSLGWQDTESEYVKEVLEDAEKIAEALSQPKDKYD